MGSDDEVWEPKPVRPYPKPSNVISNIVNNNNNNNNNDRNIGGPSNPRVTPKQPQKPIITDDSNSGFGGGGGSSARKENSYPVNLNSDKRIVTANSLKELINNIRSEYGIGNAQAIRVNYWSTQCYDWIYLDEFPPNNTKLQVILMDRNLSSDTVNKFIQSIKNEQDFNTLVRNEVVKYLDQPNNLGKHMNQALKYYVESNRPDFLPHFETSVHFIHKRYNQNHSSPSKEILVLQHKQQQTIDNLQHRLEMMRQENARLKEEIDGLKNRLDALDAPLKRKKEKEESHSKKTCSIM